MDAKKNAAGAITTKEIKQGEMITASAEEKGPCFYIIKSGRFIVNVDKDKIMELHQAEAPQCLDEDAVFGFPVGHHPAIAVENAQVLEMPLEMAKTNLMKASPVLAQILKGLMERIRTEITDLKMIKTSKNALPCPPEYTAKVFGVTFHTARFVGKMQGEELVAGWKDFFDYAVSVMDETPYRLNQTLRILVKLGFAAIEPGKTAIRFKDMTAIEAFFDFYQNYYFKSGYENLLRTNDKITATTQAFLKISQPHQADRAGIVYMPFKATIDAMKEILGKSFEADQLFRLEQKGLMIKRITTQDGGVLSFWRAEFEQMLLNWKVLREVELWNQKGFVELDEDLLQPEEKKEAAAETVDAPAKPPEPKSKKALLEQWKPKLLSGKVPQIRTAKPKEGERVCSVCMSVLEREQTFCEVCDSENPIS